jgi:hypothetical protein
MLLPQKPLEEKINMKQRTMLILILVMSFALQSCDQAQVLDSAPTSTSSPTLTPTITHTPTITPTLTHTLTPSPTLTASPIPSLPPGVENLSWVCFIDTTSYDNPGLVFTNHEVLGVSHWSTHLQNTADDSHAPVYGLSLEFTAELETIGKNIRQEYLVSAEHPVYKWVFGDVPEEPLQDVYIAEAYVQSGEGFPVSFTPGFDASLSIDKTTFSNPDIQTITITIVPREPRNTNGGADITVHAQGGTKGNVADAEIADPLPGQYNGSKDEIISVSPDRMDLFVTHLPLEENKPYSFSFTVKVDPREPNTKYMPYVSISWTPWLAASQGNMENSIARGNTLTWSIDKVGTWTWTANGEYELEWNGGSPMYMVNFGASK